MCVCVIYERIVVHERGAADGYRNVKREIPSAYPSGDRVMFSRPPTIIIIARIPNGNINVNYCTPVNYNIIIFYTRIYTVRSRPHTLQSLRSRRCRARFLLLFDKSPYER